MKIFDFDPDVHRPAFAGQGWVHVHAGATAEFIEYARGVVAQSAREAQALAGRGIRGEKQQHLFPFPPSFDIEGELLDVVAALTGLDRRRITLSERHVKAYEADADPRPAAHKDRYSSMVAVGISLEVPEGSRLVLYPKDHRQVNRFLHAGLRENLAEDQRPERVLQDAEGVEIRDVPGDVVAFLGSSMWHLRCQSSGTVNLYLKFNDVESDPLGEDPRTPARRAQSLALLDGYGAGGAADLAQAIPVLGYRFESVLREQFRDDWQERLVAQVWDEVPRAISEAELDVLRAVDGRATYAELASRLPDGALADLVHAGVLDLKSQRPSG